MGDQNHQSILGNIVLCGLTLRTVLILNLKQSRKVSLVTRQEAHEKVMFKRLIIWDDHLNWNETGIHFLQ